MIWIFVLSVILYNRIVSIDGASNSYFSDEHRLKQQQHHGKYDSSPKQHFLVQSGRELQSIENDTNAAKMRKLFEGSCHRMITFLIDQSYHPIDMRVTRKSDDMVEEISLNNDDSSFMEGFSDSFRSFTVSLPYGKYKVEFIMDTFGVWPGFVLTQFGDDPDCNEYISKSDIEVIEPAASCDELVLNGDMELGTKYWQRNFHNYHDPSSSVVSALDGAGINDSSAIKIFNRLGIFLGLGQSLDTRCIRQNLNQLYEISVFFILENDSQQVACDPFSHDYSTRCPEVLFNTKQYIDGDLQSNLFVGNLVRPVIPIKKETGYSQMHGVFKVDESIQSADRIFTLFALTDKKYDITIDNFSIKKLAPTCNGDLIRNGNFEHDGLYWRSQGGGHISIEETTSKAMKSTNRKNMYIGIVQDLYVDDKCFDEGQQFQVIGKFRIERASNGESIQCDRSVHQTELNCGYIFIRAESPLGAESVSIASTVATAPNLHQGWELMFGIMTVTEKQAAHNKIYTFLSGPHHSMNVIFDDVSIVPFKRSCDVIVMNGDFEIGDSRFWEPSNANFILMNISSQGANTSNYSIAIEPKRKDSYTQSSIRQKIDVTCLRESQELVIKAKLKLLDSSDLEKGFECDPRQWNVGRSSHCPSISITGTDCEEGNIDNLYWNEVETSQWNQNEFNEFQAVFQVQTNLLTCQNVYIEIGKFVHPETILLVDDIKILQYSTVSPTLSPTFSPTIPEKTQQPSSKTESPTTTKKVSCPPIGHDPVSLDAGHIMIDNSLNLTLCTLVKAETSLASGKTKLIPIARSHDGYDWEKSAGEYALTFFSGNDLSCYQSGCQFNIPILQVNEDYLLSTSAHSLSEVNKYARFLETASFGTTQADLDVFNLSEKSVEQSIVEFLSTQMNATSTEMTSHRVNWRRGLKDSRLPTSIMLGLPNHPCDKHARWRTTTFIRNDVLRLQDRFFTVIGNGPYQLKLNGWTRTVVESFSIESEEYEEYNFDPKYVYTLCTYPYPEERIDGIFYVQLEDGNCVPVRNPAINFDGYEDIVTNIFHFPDNILRSVEHWWNKDEVVFESQYSIFEDPSFAELCNELPATQEFHDEPIFAKLSDGTWLIFDPRMKTEDNDVYSPLEDGGKSSMVNSAGAKFCSNAPRTFLNEKGCKISFDACKSSTNNLDEITLDNYTISAINNLSMKFVYIIEGLLVNYDGIALEHPCTPGLRSRWEPQSSCEPTPLFTKTNSSLFQLLSESSDQNTYIRDIYFPNEGLDCDSMDDDPEVEISINGQCWKRVHDEHMSVFDMTYWLTRHPGGDYHIRKWSENNGTTLLYPSKSQINPHGMSNWNNNWHKFPYIGRFGDTVKLGDLPTDLRSAEIIDFFQSAEDDTSSAAIVCGSPGEVSGLKGETFQYQAGNGFETTRWDKGNNRKYVWTMVAMGAPDQLRQRVAWALSQILVIVKDAISREIGQTERFLSYYDIFVRNAFGNYFDILKEISYNALMAENLSYLGSKSSAYMLERYHVKASPENFAREIMQLFTIGLLKLNKDGSPKRDKDGNTILAYTNDDVMSFSRAWTGFDLQSPRGNLESWDNPIDPMKIVPEWRDVFPKTDTIGGYIGDKYPLCEDLPPKSFLRKGATYRLLVEPTPELMMKGPKESYYQDNVVKVTLDQKSMLRSLLCNADAKASCKYPTSVILQNNLECSGIECDVDIVRVVKLAENAYYEFVQLPCVNMAFYNDAKKIRRTNGASPVMCGNPKLPIAAEACCGNDDAGFASSNSKYTGERITFTSAAERCEAVGKKSCAQYKWVRGEYWFNYGFFWTSQSCNVQAKVHRDGTVAIVHKTIDALAKVPIVEKSSENYFKVFWRKNDFPKVENDCNNACEILPQGTCLCDTKLIESVVFRSFPSSKEEAMKKLMIGAVDPSLFDPDTFSTRFDVELNIKAYLRNNDFNKDTIFELNDEKGRKYLLKNCRSSVYIRSEHGFSGQFFRNPPHFMSFIPIERNLRDAQYETEAVLHHYFFHDNTAPFVASRLIQRLTMSNPSPRYVESVANAFISGSYTMNGVTFGTGKYGDMASTIAAIYLDRAARDVLLDVDISSGSLREPILKVLAVLRSMEFKTETPITQLDKVMDTIGQMAHEFKSVFSFFQPDYKPNGRIGDATLSSPEATVLDMPHTLGLLNGLTSMAKYGLTSCDGGWSWHRCIERKYKSSPLGVLQYNRTSTTSFDVETFEGPSLNGGLDNEWIGRNYNLHNGQISLDPKSIDGNHVLHFPKHSWSGQFFSQSIDNSIPLHIKFRFLNTGSTGGGCIGYVDIAVDPMTENWLLCDGSAMISNREWISCQFSVPSQVKNFRLVVGDRQSPGGQAYFDDIQLNSGRATTTCDNVEFAFRTSSKGRVGYSNEVVERLSTLLTAGRLQNNSKEIIAEAFDNAGSVQDGLRISQQLLMTTAEFHTTNLVKSTKEERDPVSFPKKTGRPYKAIIYLMLNGGCDSYNMLTPYTCSNGLYETYLDVRQQVALPKNRLLPIDAENQVCDEFGIHPSLPVVKSLYDDEDLLFFANTGVLSQPVTKENYYELTNMQLFAHNHMVRETERIDPYEYMSGTGVLGRMRDILVDNGHNVGSFTVDGFSAALTGETGKSDAPIKVTATGVPQMYLEETEEYLSKLHNVSVEDSGLFAETWSSSLMASVETNKLLSSELENVTTTIDFPRNYLGRTMETVARLIATREARGVDTDTFYIQRGGFDTHSDVEKILDELFVELNDSIEALTREMKANGIWNNVTLIQTSDFARTLNPNGGDGTDHGWAGNYMMMGGSVKGRKILGQYPDDLTDDGPLTLSRGRMIPTTPWEAPFLGLATWLGINALDMNKVCPNLHRFNSSYLFDFEDMFDSSNKSNESPHKQTSDRPSSVPTTTKQMTPSPSNTLSSFSPLPSPSSCSDISCVDTDERFFIASMGVKKDCIWVGRVADMQAMRCAIPEVAEHCCESCCNLPPAAAPSNSNELTPSPTTASSPTSSCSDISCVDTDERFFIASIGVKKDCIWAARSAGLKAKRCAIPEVAEHCCESCCNLPPAAAPSNSNKLTPSPITVSSPTSSCSDISCVDTDERFFIASMGVKKDCIWVGRVADMQAMRCAIPEVAEHCCESCCNLPPAAAPSNSNELTPSPITASSPTSSCSDISCVDTDERFFIASMGVKKDCIWVGRVADMQAMRCAIPEVAEHCCQSCCSFSSQILTSSPSTPTVSSCQSTCSDTDMNGKFTISSLKGAKSCRWAVSVSVNHARRRCTLPEVAKNCCHSCCSVNDSGGSGLSNPQVSPTSNPITNPTTTSSCPTSCKNDLTKGKFSISGLSGLKTCRWAVKFGEKTKAKRCALPEVKENCCHSCCKSTSTTPPSPPTSNTTPQNPNIVCPLGDEAGNSKFHVPGSDKKVGCSWASKYPVKRCSIDVVSRLCCKTCYDGLSMKRRKFPF